MSFKYLLLLVLIALITICGFYMNQQKMKQLRKGDSVSESYGKIAHWYDNHHAAKPYFVFLTGTSGSGKTTILKAIAKELSTDAVSINYFDDIGVPSFEEMVANYGSPEKWQEAMTHLWIEKLANITDKKLIFLEGSFNPEFAVSHLQKLGMHNYLIICVHAERAVREKRLSQQRNQPELITQDMENFAQQLKAKTLVLGGIVVESTDNNLSNVVEEIMEIIAKRVGKW